MIAPLCACGHSKADHGDMNDVCRFCGKPESYGWHRNIAAVSYHTFGARSTEAATGDAKPTCATENCGNPRAAFDDMFCIGCARQIGALCRPVRAVEKKCRIAALEAEVARMAKELEEPTMANDRNTNDRTWIVVTTLGEQIMAEMKILASEENEPGGGPDESDRKIIDCRKRIKELREMRENYENTMAGTSGR